MPAEDKTPAASTETVKEANNEAPATPELTTPGESKTGESTATETVKEAKKETQKRQSKGKGKTDAPKTKAPKSDPPAPKASATQSQVKPGNVPRRQVQHIKDAHRVDYSGPDTDVGNMKWSNKYPTRTTRYFRNREDAEVFEDEPGFTVTYHD